MSVCDSSFKMEMRMGFAVTDPLAQVAIPLVYTRDVRLPRWVIVKRKRRAHGRTNGPKQWKTIKRWR